MKLFSKRKEVYGFTQKMEQLFQMLKIINNFKYFEYKTKLLGDTEVDRNNEVLENETSSVLLKYLTNFWKSTEMP